MPRHCASVRCMIYDRPVIGILLMLGFCVVAPMGDAVAKILGATVPLGILLLVRFAVQAGVLIPMVIARDLTWRMSRRVLKLTILRTLLHIAGIGAMVTALQYLPLADAVSIAFVMPFMMLLLGHFVLGEEVGHRRVIACAVGFAGTLMVIQPSFAEVGWPALWPLGVAATFSLFMLVTRKIAKDTDPVGLQAVSGVIAIAIMLPVVLIAHLTLDIPALTLTAPSQTEWVLLVTIGLLGTAAHLLMTWSLRYAPAATLAPMQYLEIPVAAALGFVVFAELPDTLAAAGICVTICAGVYILIRERAGAIARQATVRASKAQVPA